MAPRRRGERPLRRRAPQIDERARFVIFCEGELTEPLYVFTSGNLGLGGYSQESIAGLGVDVGEALWRTEAPWNRSQILQKNRSAECSRLGQR